MICHPAEKNFRKGREALSEGRYLEAQAFFEVSVTLSRQMSKGAVQPRYISFYGVCLSKEKGKKGNASKAQELCVKATQAEPYDPDLWLNLCIVSMARGDRAGAYNALVRGLQTSPTHQGLLKQLREMGYRRRPMIRFLSRDNVLNKLAGRLTRRAKKRR